VAVVPCFESAPVGFAPIQRVSESAHPSSPSFESPFPDAILPLDAKLSWKNRFNGDETFNEQETLGQKTSMTVMDHSSHGDMAKDKVGMGMDAMGVIKQIKPGQGKIKIEHGAIERMGMPAMTMMFKVEDMSILDGLEKGNTVGFSVDNSSGGFVVTNLMRMPADGKDPDAMGMEHGPIDRLGMPAMTMMFKVNDPSQLEGIEKGSTVDFSVDNSSGGFVITNIKPAK